MKHRPLRRRRWLAILALPLLLSGCAAPVQMPLDPALFPRSAGASAGQVAGRVALLVPPPVAAALSQHEERAALQAVQLPIGRIVEKAALLALGDALSGGLRSVDAAPAADSGVSATLVIESVRCVHRVHLLWIVPIPYVGPVGADQTDVQVTFELRLLDARGRSVWTQAYDSGRQIWKPPFLPGKETRNAAIARLAHEGAWNLMQQAVVDVRDWLAAERVKPREL